MTSSHQYPALQFVFGTQDLGLAPGDQSWVDREIGQISSAVWGEETGAPAIYQEDSNQTPAYRAALSALELQRMANRVVCKELGGGVEYALVFQHEKHRGDLCFTVRVATANPDPQIFLLKAWPLDKMVDITGQTPFGTLVSPELSMGCVLEHLQDTHELPKKLPWAVFENLDCFHFSTHLVTKGATPPPTSHGASKASGIQSLPANLPSELPEVNAYHASFTTYMSGTVSVNDFCGGRSEEGGRENPIAKIVHDLKKTIGKLDSMLPPASPMRAVLKSLGLALPQADSDGSRKHVSPLLLSPY
jgi:hypothetical protein